MKNPEHRPKNSKEELAQTEHLTGRELYKTIKEIYQTSYVTGLPCGELREFISVASHEDQESLHLQASNEREAVGLAAGAWLGGEKPLLYMQNSGLFESSNDLGSLLIAAKIPAVFVVSWRGAPGENATQHFATGAATKPLLEAFNIPYTDHAAKDWLNEAQKWQEETSLPVCILQIRERFNKPEPQERQAASRRKKTEVFIEDDQEFKSREEMLAVIAAMTPQSRALISSTGLISRSLYHHSDSPNQFYNAGAFGLTSSLGLGFASSKSKAPVTVVEGDGSVLTNLGNLNLIGYSHPSNFLHIVLDNASYISCSGEPTCGHDLIPELASVTGYDQIYSVSSPETLSNIMQYATQKESKGPVMIHVKINQEGERSFDRPLGMAQIAKRFKQHFTKQGQDA